MGMNGSKRKEADSADSSTFIVVALVVDRRAPRRVVGVRVVSIERSE